MSVIGQIEVANFLNLDNIKPYEPDWCAHYPHLVLDNRGTNTIVQLSNGGGKTTITNALFLLLTRDRALNSSVKKILAPKRKGLFSHVRIEVRYRDNSELLQPGMFGDIPGEAYVIGLYGFSDKTDNLKFYIYQGTLNDCPVAYTNEVDGKIKVQHVVNAVFLDNLRKQKHYKSRLTSEYLAEIHTHFDEKFLSQQLQYHKLGAGDGNSNFFSTTNQRDEEFCTSFFYEHIAPEVLVDCMGDYADSEEVHFEDTLIKSAREVIKIELEQSKVNEKLIKLKSSFDWLEKANTDFNSYQKQSSKLMKYVSHLWQELQFMKDCVFNNPLPYIPNIITTGSENLETMMIANSLVYLNGTWLIPDFAICKLFDDLNVKHLNQKSDRKNITSQRLKSSQVIEIPCDLKKKFVKRGHENRGYTISDAIELISQIDDSNLSNHDRDTIKRHVRYGYDLRINQGEINPFRAYIGELNDKISSLKESNTSLGIENQELEKKEFSLSNQVQHFNLAESSYQKMLESTLFSEEELHTPIKTKQLLSDLIKETEQQLEALISEQQKWAKDRVDYKEVIENFSTQNLTTLHQNIIDSKKSSEKEHNEIQESSGQAQAQILIKEQELADVQKDFTIASEQYNELNKFKPAYEVVTAVFSEDKIPTLRESLTTALQNAIKELDAIKEELGNLSYKSDRLKELSNTYDEFNVRFEGEEKATGLKLKLETQKTKSVIALEKCVSSQKEIVANIDNLKQLQPLFARVSECYKHLGIPLSDVAAYLQSEKLSLESKLKEYRQLQLSYSPLLEALQYFQNNYDGDINVQITKHKEHLSKLQNNKQQILSLISENKKKLERYKKAGIAPLSIASQVHSAINYSGNTVAKIIDSLNIADERRLYLLTQFSHLLHAPVSDNRQQALELAKHLSDLELEYPVFELCSFKAFCESNDESKCSFIVGVETLQVKAILDPLFINELIDNTNQALDKLNLDLRVINENIQKYDLDEELYTNLKGAKEALDNNIEAKDISTKADIKNTNHELEQVVSYINNPLRGELESACTFIRLGGQQALESNEEKLNVCKKSIKESQNNINYLDSILTDELINILVQAEQFEKEGGQKSLEQVTTKISNLNDKLKKASNEKKYSEAQYHHFVPYLDDAEKFVERGGLNTFQLVKEAERQHEESNQKITEELYQLRSDARVLSEKLALANSNLIKAVSMHDSWINKLTNALHYLNEGGLDFDLKYDDEKDIKKTTLERCKNKIVFSFDEAQQYVDALSNNIDRAELIKKLSLIKTQLGNNRIHISDNNQDIEDLRIEINEKSGDIHEFDHSLNIILTKYREAQNLLSFIQDKFEMENVESQISANLKFAQDVVNEIRDCELDKLSDAQELYPSLADIVTRLSFSEQKSEISRKNKEITASYNKLINFINHSRDNDSGLMESERKELMPTNENELFKKIVTYKKSFQSLCSKAENRCKELYQDVESQHDNLNKSMSLLTSQLRGNFDLLRKTLLPGRSRAGFYVEADIIDKDKIKERLNRLIDSIRQREINRSRDKEKSDLNGINIEPESKYLTQLKSHIRENFYRTVFKGKDDNSAPMMFFSHPSLAKGARKKLSKDFSTGQKTALSLLLLTKLAQFSSARSKNIGFGLVQTKRKESSNKVVIIDGLFSNLSDPSLIKFSLETVRMMEDEFQLIGWVHSPEYKNDFKIFPTLYAIHRVSSSGYVVAEDKSKHSSSLMVTGSLFIDDLGKDGDELH